MWRGEKALNLAVIVANKPTIGIVIRQLQVRGLLLSFVFDGFKMQIRALIIGNCPYIIITVRSHFLGKKMRPGTQVFA